MREEQFEKPKLLPILQEAYQLVEQMEAIEKKGKSEMSKFFQIIKEKKTKNKQEIAKNTVEWLKKKEEKKKTEEEERKKREEENKKLEEKKMKQLEKKKKQEEERLKKFKESNKPPSNNKPSIRQVNNSKDRKHKDNEIY